jgi:hypothetical protein
MATPVTVVRFVQELEKLKGLMDAGKLEHGEYDQRLSRVIKELRERGLDANRAEIATAIDESLEKGVITASVKNHLRKRLGLD